jgi:hypothetical protein
MFTKENYAQKIKELTGWNTNQARMNIVTDTTEWMKINRGDILILDGNEYLIKGNMHEARFGIEEQPKFWVFGAIELNSGKDKIIKTEYNEEFYAHISILKIRCYRSPAKESEVMNLMNGDERFMQGLTFFDEKGNNVRVIDFIRGLSFFHYLPTIKKQHEEYFYEDFPILMKNLFESFLAIKKLHKYKLCHGDIRNDHLYIETDTGNYRWIDFDLKQDVSDFDLWSIGNIICYCASKGIITFDKILKDKNVPDNIKQGLEASDGSAFYQYRIMNIKKIFPYIPQKLANILQHFTIKPIGFYSGIDELCDAYYDMITTEL